MEFDKTMIGKKVRMVHRENYILNLDQPYYPENGTIGVIKDIDSPIMAQIQWPEGTTILDDLWWIDGDGIEFVEEENNE